MKVIEARTDGVQGFSKRVRDLARDIENNKLGVDVDREVDVNVVVEVKLDMPAEVENLPCEAPP